MVKLKRCISRMFSAHHQGRGRRWPYRSRRVRAGRRTSLPVPKVQDLELGQERGWQEDLPTEEDRLGRYQVISLISFLLAEACFLVGSALTMIVRQHLLHLVVPHNLI
jgi:hypothetical protein